MAKLVPPSAAELLARGLNPDGTPLVKHTPKVPEVAEKKALKAKVKE